MPANLDIDDSLGSVTDHQDHHHAGQQASHGVVTPVIITNFIFSFLMPSCHELRRKSYKVRVKSKRQY